mgnify:CR=1 FL=1
MSTLSPPDPLPISGAEAIGGQEVAPRQRLLCARDHTGTRPFYYYCSSGFIAFASELPQLLALAEGNGVRCLRAPALAKWSRRQVDELETFVKERVHNLTGKVEKVGFKRYVAVVMASGEWPSSLPVARPIS